MNVSLTILVTLMLIVQTRSDRFSVLVNQVMSVMVLTVQVCMNIVCEVLYIRHR